MAKVRDFTAAKALVTQLNRNGEISEATLLGFAQARKYEETVATLALLSQSTIEVIRPLMQSPRNDGLLVACKVARLGWETVSAILACRFSTGALGSQELAKAKVQFAGVTAEGAHQLFKTWQARASSSGSKLH
jgi:hypothetical protein